MRHLLSSLCRPLIFATCVIALLSGCRAVQQEVTIVSNPPGARVVVDGEDVGYTPVAVTLETRQPHSVRLERSGYQTVQQTLHSVPNEEAKNVVRFGLVDDAGGYRQLIPAALKVELTSELVPARQGLDPFAELANRIVQLDLQLSEGRISPEEHRMIQNQLIQFFQ